LVGVAVNVAVAPEHIVEELAEIATAGVTRGFTVMVTVFELAVGFAGHNAVVVITHCTVFPFAKAALVYVELFVPTFAPFNFH
jgi:hypothetical protein